MEVPIFILFLSEVPDISDLMNRDLERTLKQDSLPWIILPGLKLQVISLAKIMFLGEVLLLD